MLMPSNRMYTIIYFVSSLTFYLCRSMTASLATVTTHLQNSHSIWQTIIDTFNLMVTWDLALQPTMFCWLMVYLVQMIILIDIFRPDGMLNKRSDRCWSFQQKTFTGTVTGLLIVALGCKLECLSYYACMIKRATWSPWPSSQTTYKQYPFQSWMATIYISCI